MSFSPPDLTLTLPHRSYHGEALHRQRDDQHEIRNRRRRLTITTGLTHLGPTLIQMEVPICLPVSEDA